MGARTRAAARAFHADPAVAGLRRRVAALGDRPSGEALVAAAGPLLDDIGWLRRLIARGVADLAADPVHEPPFRPLPHGRQVGLLLWQGGGLRLTLARVPLETLAEHKAGAEGGRSISFTGLVSDTRVIRGAAVLGWWQAPAAGVVFTAATAGTARPDGHLPLHAGTRFRTDGRRQAWTVAQAAGDLVLLEARAPAGDAPLAVEYDAVDGRFLSASAADGTATRLQLAATMLREMGRRDAAPAIAAAATALPFFARWHLLQELARLDAAAVVPALRAAAADDHPELAAAARTALARLAA